jgi:hypothetical protein
MLEEKFKPNAMIPQEQGFFIAFKIHSLCTSDF